jgi:CO dehydrogenase/acetyl-CoA synthase beta subunit
MFSTYIDKTLELADAEDLVDRTRTFTYNTRVLWPKVKRQIILPGDMALELGAPGSESTSFLMWTDVGSDTAQRVVDGRIRLIGPDIREAPTQELPFGKVVLVSGHGFDESNAYSRYSEMDRLKLKLDLSGYMLHAAPQQNREWGRVGKQALAEGFSLEVLGNELIRSLKALPYVDATEVIMVTSSAEEVRRFKPLGDKVARAVVAMDKMLEHLAYDCGNCDFQDVCDEVDELRVMHRRQREGR